MDDAPHLYLPSVPPGAEQALLAGGLGMSIEISLKLFEPVGGFDFNLCLFLPLGVYSHSTCVAYLMEPCANEVSVLLKGGILS